jgi:hypothetical protein
MFLRLLPFLQRTDDGFGSQWIADWNLLDNSFRYMVMGLNKPVSRAVEVLVDIKFAFGPQCRYFDHILPEEPASS